MPTPETELALAEAIIAVRKIMVSANAEVFGRAHSHQTPDRIYGQAHTLLISLLVELYGARDGDRVYELMMESGEDHVYCARILPEVYGGES